MSTTRLAKAKSRQVGIGITTRDRWDDLAVTLSELKMRGYEDVETIVIDDGSKQPLPQSLGAAFPIVRFERVLQAGKLTGNCLVLEVALEHPERLFVLLETLDHQILRLQIACCASGVPCAQLIVADLLVRDDQRGHVILLRQRRFEFLHLRNLRERAQASDGVSVECANTLRDFIDRLEKVFILFLKVRPALI
jgi:hypothetical protein